VAQEALTQGMVAGVDCSRKKKKVCSGDRKEFAAVVLQLVRIWVRGEAEPPFVGGGERKKIEKCSLEKK